VLNVKDIERSHAFWTEIVGFKQVGALPEDRPMKMRLRRAGRLPPPRPRPGAGRQPRRVPDPGPWSMRGTKTGVNHVAIKYPDRESWPVRSPFSRAKA
jgi:catechol 2,3-dioxygenase